MGVVPFTGPSYQYRDLGFDAQRSVNCYRVKSESGNSKATYGLVGTPGRNLFTNIGNDGTRGSKSVNGRNFFVSGLFLYEIFADGTKTQRGTLNTQYGPVALESNGLQLMLVDGANGYVLTLATNVYAQVTDPYFLGSDTIAFIDGYFILNKPNSSTFYLSASYDGTTGDALMFEQVQGFTDNLIAVHAVHNQLWLLGQTAIQIYYDSGDTFPFTAISGIFVEYGCVAAQSVVNSANTLFWLGNDRQGSGIVWMANGYQPQRISTNPVETAIQTYGDISTATAYTYQEDGHYFYCLNFAMANTTWVYDINMDEWHERAYFNLGTGAYERDRAQSHIYAFGLHLVGDYQNGNIYSQDIDFHTDNGNPIRRLRAAPHLADDLEYIYYHRFQLDMETGVGLTTGNAADVTPQIVLQWSDDGGYSWSNEHWRDVGPVGNRRKRVLWRMLGRSRDRVFRIIYTAATKFFVIAAHAETEKGTN